MIIEAQKQARNKEDFIPLNQRPKVDNLDDDFSYDPFRLEDKSYRKLIWIFSAKKRDIFKDFGGTSLFGSTLSDMENTRRDFMSGMNKPQVQYKPTGYSQVSVDR